jgi:putative ABC transport system ATP-binding protein
MGLRIENLIKRYIAPDGSVVPVIDLPELHLADGEEVALIGTSGSGKTTLLHLIAGILAPDSGRIEFNVGRPPEAISVGVSGKTLDYARKAPARPGSFDLASLSEAERDVFRGQHIGYVFQTHHLLPGFTALENVLLGMSFTGRPADRKWAEHLLREVGLSERLHYKPQKLSVGQQQRVAVARALANRPKLVLADEPTGALDATNAQQVLDLIRSLCREVNAALLLVTHDQNIARQFSRVLTLSHLNRAAAAFPASASA